MPLTATKAQTEPLGDWFGLNVVARYDTREKAPGFGDKDDLKQPPPSFGAMWQSSLHKSLMFQSDGQGGIGAVQALRGAWQKRSFARNGVDQYAGPSDSLDALSFNASQNAWTYRDQTARSIETYDSTGRLQNVHFANGAQLTYQYISALPSATAMLAHVTDQFGRSLRFDYEQPAGAAAPRINRMVDPAANEISFGYDSNGNLSSIARRGEPARTLLYENTALNWALTGIVGEDGRRVSTYAFDSEGRALSTELAGGVNRFALTYKNSPVWNIIDTVDGVRELVHRDYYWQLPTESAMQLPNGQSVEYTFQTVNGMARLASSTQPAGAGCAASSSSQSYDTHGNTIQRDNFNGNRACFAYDALRNLETVKVEGLGTSATCTNYLKGAALPAASRKFSTAWHPDWSLAILQAEPGRITTAVYNGQPDPFAGGDPASCAPTTATLPDGKPVTVLCRQVEQPTTDADGSQGFAAQRQAGVPARERRWTYNQYGQVLSSTDPRGNTTRYAYYADTAFSGSDPHAVGHTVGDLQSVTNPAGHGTQYTQYEKAGKPLTLIDPNGILTSNLYDPRQRLISSTVGGQTSTYEYWPTGLLKKATQPDGSSVNYGYDDAHRLVNVGDNLGNSISYTLDNAGNRTAETVTDAGGSLRGQINRHIDALGRVQERTGRGMTP